MPFRTIRASCPSGRGSSRWFDHGHRPEHNAGLPLFSPPRTAWRPCSEGPYAKAAVFLAGAAMAVAYLLSAAENAWWPFSRGEPDRLVVVIMPSRERIGADDCWAGTVPEPEPEPLASTLSAG